MKNKIIESEEQGKEYDDEMDTESRGFKEVFSDVIKATLVLVGSYFLYLTLTGRESSELEITTFLDFLMGLVWCSCFVFVLVIFLIPFYVIAKYYISGDVEEDECDEEEANSTYLEKKINRVNNAALMDKRWKENQSKGGRNEIK